MARQMPPASNKINQQVRFEQEEVMPHFVTLIRYTQQGITRIKETPTQLDAAKKAAERAGGKIHAWYLTMGQYDAVCIRSPRIHDPSTAFFRRIRQPRLLRIECQISAQCGGSLTGVPSVAHGSVALLRIPPLS